MNSDSWSLPQHLWGANHCRL